jgi:peptidoglycan-associated lipoprotein
LSDDQDLLFSGENMKRTFATTLTITAIIGSLFLFNAGCSKKTVVPPANAGGDLSGGNDINYPKADGGYSEENLPTSGTLDDNGRSGQGGSDADRLAAADSQSDEYKRLHGRCSPGLFPVYFDFDQSGIRSDMVDVITKNADFINSKGSGSTVLLEGNTDERGTNEYNIALAERRAVSVQQYLINMGVDAQRIQTVSYGEERPLFTGQDEESYAGNRRVDFVLK